MSGRVRFIHTADWQIGKPFAGIEDEHNRSLVQQERISVLSRIADLVQEGGIDFVLVAGDLFDSTTPTKSMVSAACAAIGKIACPVLAIPGNHDHAGPGCLWEQRFFRQEQTSLSPNFRLLLSPEPFELGNTVIFPCPLLRRAESLDTTTWLRDAAVAQSGGEKSRIVLAHGSIQGFGQDVDEEELSSATNQIDLSRLDVDAFDYIALGDWHGTKQISSKAWYSGTPEIDRFPKGSDNLPGNVLDVTVERGALPKIGVVSTGRFRWHKVDHPFPDDSGIALLQSDLEATLGQRAQEDLLRLELSGTLSFQAKGELENLIEKLSARLLRLKIIDRTLLSPTIGEIEALTQRHQDPLIASVVGKLLEKTNAGDPVAQIALRELHVACHEFA